MPGQRTASADNDLPALVRVPDWTQPPDPASSPAGQEGDIAPRASPGRKPPVLPGDRLGEIGTDWPTRFARVLAEALAGARPPAQILPWTSKRARSQFLRLSRAFAYGDHHGAGARAGGAARGCGQLRIVRVVATRPARDAIEMSVIARFGERVRALALRLEQTTSEDSPGKWICTDIEAA
jgi:Family of unknown function (DUF6459)